MQAIMIQSHPILEIITTKKNRGANWSSISGHLLKRHLKFIIN